MKILTLSPTLDAQVDSLSRINTSFPYRNKDYASLLPTNPQITSTSLPLPIPDIDPTRFFPNSLLVNLMLPIDYFDSSECLDEPDAKRVRIDENCAYKTGGVLVSRDSSRGLEDLESGKSLDDRQSSIGNSRRGLEDQESTKNSITEKLLDDRQSIRNSSRGLEDQESTKNSSTGKIKISDDRRESSKYSQEDGKKDQDKKRDNDKRDDRPRNDDKRDDKGGSSYRPKYDDRKRDDSRKRGSRDYDRRDDDRDYKSSRREDDRDSRRRDDDLDSKRNDSLRRDDDRDSKRREDDRDSKRNECSRRDDDRDPKRNDSLRRDDDRDSKRREDDRDSKRNESSRRDDDRDSKRRDDDRDSYRNESSKRDDHRDSKRRDDDRDSKRNENSRRDDDRDSRNRKDNPKDTERTSSSKKQDLPSELIKHIKSNSPTIIVEKRPRRISKSPPKTVDTTKLTEPSILISESKSTTDSPSSTRPQPRKINLKAYLETTTIDQETPPPLKSNISKTFDIARAHKRKCEELISKKQHFFASCHGVAGCLYYITHFQENEERNALNLYSNDTSKSIFALYNLRIRETESKYPILNSLLFVFNNAGLDYYCISTTRNIYTAPGCY